MVTPTTKYTKKHSRTGLDSRKDKVVITKSDDEVKEYICDSCNFIIHTRLTDGEVYCRCGNVIEVQNVRRRSKLQTPNRSTETLVSKTPMPGYGDVVIKKQPNYKGTFKSLSEKGLKITDYKELPK